MEELAEEAGITVRTLRFYRERKLIPPPRREGRIAWYDDHHLARLRTIARPPGARPHPRRHRRTPLRLRIGRDVGEVLGLRRHRLALSEETPVRLTPEELADYFEGEVTAENLAAAMDLGYLAIDGDEIVHISRRLLDASTELVGQGVPLAAVLEAGRQVREHADALADLFTNLIRTHVLDDILDRTAAGDRGPREVDPCRNHARPSGRGGGDVDGHGPPRPRGTRGVGTRTRLRGGAGPRRARGHPPHQALSRARRSKTTVTGAWSLHRSSCVAARSTKAFTARPARPGVPPG